MFSLLSILFVILQDCNGEQFLDPTRFSAVLSDLKENVLGVTRMQQYLDNSKFVQTKLEGDKLINDLAEKLKQRFQEKIDAVQDIRIAVEEAYDNKLDTGIPNFQECCKIEPIIEDYRFKAKVFFDRLCETRAKSVTENPKHLPKSMFDTMSKIAKEKSNMRWQYFGSEEGMFFSFPAVKFSDCSSYDPRTRPWYVQAISPNAKDVVIVIDRSGSMKEELNGTSLMDIAADAASTVLDTLNPKDRAGIVTIGEKAETPPGTKETSDCYKDRLATAVPVNIKYLKRYLRNISPEGETYYSSALEKAFELLKSPNEVGYESLRRQKIILFMTDGRPTEKNISKMLEDLAKEKLSLINATSSSAIILAYGIGDQDFTFLKQIAEDTESEQIKGTFTAISKKDIGQLRRSLLSYYNLFAKNFVHGSHSLSVPYTDALGLGVMVTVAIPCLHKGKVVGVAGADVVFSELISQVFYFSKGEYSYAFLIDRVTGTTLIHPLLPTPQAINEDSVIVHITVLEREKEFNSVLKSMISGGEGRLNFISKRYFSVGSGSKSGVKEIEVNSTYFWRPVQGTNLSVCIVLLQHDTESRIESGTVSSSSSLIYHREIDLTEKKDGFTLCSHFGKQATKDHAAVKFSPQCFENPFYYATMIETKESVDSFREYLNHGGRNPKPEFKLGVRELALVGLKAEKIWKERSIYRYQDYTVYLTYATTNGIMFTKPGIVIPKPFDPSQTLWFRNAINHKGQLTLSTPYLDEFGSGFLIHLTHTLHEKISCEQNLEICKVLAILDASIGLFQFYRLLTETYPKCVWDRHRCFIIDNNGFFVIHRYFVDYTTLSDLDSLADKISNTHITELERSVAKDLIRRKVLIKKQCQLINESKTKNVYEVHLNGSFETHSSKCPNYQLTRISGTNVFLGVVDDSKCSKTEGSCHCPTSVYDSADLEECICPFKSSLDYDYCKNQFPSKKAPLCAVPPPIVSSFDTLEKSPGDLENCFAGNCRNIKAERSCYQISYCSWCTYSKVEKSFLKNPYCESSEKCYGGVEGNQLSVLYPSGKKDPKQKYSSNILLTAGYVGGGGVGLLIILSVVSYKLLQRKKRSQPNNPDETKPESTVRYGPRSNSTCVEENEYETANSCYVNCN